MRGVATYWYLLAALILCGGVLGFAAPALVSSRHTEFVMLGFALVALLPMAALYLFARWQRTADGRQILKRLLPVVLLAVMLGACSKVPAGHVGVVVNLYGSEKGVSEREVGPGRYWIGWNEELYLFPTFTQNDTWQRIEGKKDESITFQTGKDGMVLNADFGMTYRVDPTKVAKLFQAYRRGVEEISDIYLRNLVRDALNEEAAALTADEAYGRKKNELMDTVEGSVRKQVSEKGIIIEKAYLVGEIRLPPQVKAALDLKNAAFQETLRREQEVAKAKAEADIAVAQARGVADSTLLRATAEAEANRMIALSLTTELVRYRALDKWDGVLPRINGAGAVPFVDVTAEAKK